MPQNILLIEDDTFLSDMLKTKLEAAGYAVTVVADGKQGLDTMQSLRPALVLLDIMLPTMDGYAILQAKKTMPDIATIPVIVISNSGQPVEISRVVALGVRDYFVKAQIDPEDIVEKVKNQLAAPSSGALAGKRILMVEDDQFLRELLGMKLSAEQVEMYYATSGEQAIQLAEEKRPDVILLDLLLPEMDGFEILSRLKANSKTAPIPVIVLSNLGEQQDINRAKSLGAAEFFVKAMLTPDKIVQRIDGVLSGTGGAPAPAAPASAPMPPPVAPPPPASPIPPPPPAA